MAQHINTNTVTEAMLARATRILDFQARQIVYLVENSRGEVNDQGEVICYQVRYNKDHHILQCLPHNGPACKASEFGMTCHHMRIAVKAAELFKAEVAARIQETEKTLREIEADERAMWLETSSSLDGVKWEVCPASGNRVPMR